MYLIRRVIYYLGSVITLLSGIRNWPSLIRLITPGDEDHILIMRDGTRFAVGSLMDAWVVKETTLDRDYERAGVPIQDGWAVVDIGAGLGDFSVQAAKRTPHGSVVAFEPAPSSVKLLERNLALNSIANVEIHPVAVALRDSTINLDISGGVAVQYKTVEGEKQGATIAVKSVALSDVLRGLPGGVCDFLKMDCEGAEYDMLLNLDDDSFERIKRVCLEYHENVTRYTHRDLEQKFKSMGWSVRVMPSLVRKELGLLYAEAA